MSAASVAESDVVVNERVKGGGARAAVTGSSAAPTVAMSVSGDADGDARSERAPRQHTRLKRKRDEGEADEDEAEDPVPSRASTSASARTSAASSQSDDAGSMSDSSGSGSGGGGGGDDEDDEDDDGTGSEAPKALTAVVAAPPRKPPSAPVVTLPPSKKARVVGAAAAATGAVAKKSAPAAKPAAAKPAAVKPAAAKPAAAKPSAKSAAAAAVDDGTATSVGPGERVGDDARSIVSRASEGGGSKGGGGPATVVGDASNDDNDNNDNNDVEIGTGDALTGPALNPRAAATASYDALAIAARAAGDEHKDRLLAIMAQLGQAPDNFEFALKPETLVACVDFMRMWWCEPRPEDDTNPVHAAAVRMELDKLYETGAMESSNVGRSFSAAYFQNMRVEAGLMKSGAVRGTNSVEDVGGMLRATLSAVRVAIYAARELLNASLAWSRAVGGGGGKRGKGGGSASAANAQILNPKATLGYAQGLEASRDAGAKAARLIVFLLGKLRDHGFRRYGDSCYVQVRSPPLGEHGTTYPTHAWKRVGAIAEFVRMMASKEVDEVQWVASLGGGTLAKAVEDLTLGYHAEFAPLKPDRAWHAFRNGLLCTRTLCFYEYGSSSVPSGVTACKYHDADFPLTNLTSPWHALQTPAFERIFDTQLEGVDDSERGAVRAWLYVFLGRLLYNLGEYDSWQVMMFIVGRAGTGKSMLLKGVGWFFNEEDVETMSNNAQQVFGLETLLNKWMWRCYEVKSDFAVPQTDLQSLISHEPLSIARKFKTAITVTIDAPGIMAGNEVAAWVDNSGSMSRRIILCPFDRVVAADKSDPMLESKMRAELPTFMFKAMCAYRAAAAEFGTREIWASYHRPDGRTMPILPPYFHVAKRRLKEMTHPLAEALRNESMLGQEAADAQLPSLTTAEKDAMRKAGRRGMPFTVFKSVVGAFMHNRNRRPMQWKHDKYDTVFADAGITVSALGKIAGLAQLWGEDYDATENKVKYGDTWYAQDTEWLQGVYQRTEAQIQRALGIDYAPMLEANKHKAAKDKAAAKFAKAAESERPPGRAYDVSASMKTAVTRSGDIDPTMVDACKANGGAGDPVAEH